MHIRTLAVGLALSALLSATAQAQEAQPLTGTGENVAGVARIAIPGANEVELAGDWAFVSRDAEGGQQGGLTIVNIADPTKPYIESEWSADDENLKGSFGDVDLSADGNLAVITNAHASSPTYWAVLLDVSDKAVPRYLSRIRDDANMNYVHTATLDRNLLYLNPQVAAFYPQPNNAEISIFDIADPENPVRKGAVAPPGADLGLAHDSYIDRRPDGRNLLYAASVHKVDVIDVTNPFQSTWLQTTTSPAYTIAHDVQPNFDRSIIIVDDEGAAGGQLDESVSACGKAGAGPASADSGSVHFFQAAPDGTLAAAGALRLGSFNAPTNTNTGACVAHVFSQAPNENRLTQAYYRTGAFIVDFENPMFPEMLGWFLPTGGAKYWSNKPHKGYLYATDMNGNLDVLRYTGEEGKRWPATAGPAEVQRAARQGVPPIAVTSTPSGE